MELSNASCEAAREVSFNSVLFKAIVLLLLAFCLVSTASAKYSVERAETNITVSDRGIAHVEESVSYAFDGNYIDVYRELKALPGESIQNVEGRCSNKGCTIRVKRIPEGYKLIGKLPDPTPRKVTLFVSYDYYGAVKVHRDVSEFHYKLWGGEWQKPVGSLKGSITLPAENGSEVRYWTHPIGYTQEINVENNVINLKTGEIPSTQWYEIQAVFPRIKSPDPNIVQIDNANGLEKVLTIEDAYLKKTLILDSLYRKTVVFSLLILVFPLLIYFRYGKEQKTDYKEKYERKPPADSKPAIVNSIIYRRMGISKIEGFTATFMDLANRNYISLRNLKPEEIDSLNTPESEPPESGTLKSENEESESRDFILELINNEIYSEDEKNLSELEDFEKDMLYLLKAHASERKISWKKFKEEFESGKDFYHFITVWNKKVEVHVPFEKFFQSTGNIYINRFSRFILITAIIYYILISGFFPSGLFPLTSKINVLTSLIGIFGFVMIKYSGMFTTTFGRWTPDGNLYYKQWDSFKKYITDLSALKENSPESVKIWDSYIVYAASLGVAKEALQNMSQIVPPEKLKESHFYPISNNYSQSKYSYVNTCSLSDSEEENREDDVGSSSKSVS